MKQPWAWAIIHGGKDVENRSRPTKHRGQLYIHAGKSVAPEALDFPPMRAALSANGPELPAGFVYGTVDVIDCHAAEDCENWAETGSLCSAWAMPGFFHWVLATPRPLACPFPEKGKLGLWNLGRVP